MKSVKYGLQMTASVWMLFNQTYEEESGDADFDSFKTPPWDAGGTQRDEVHETMCRARVNNIDGSTTKNTECVFPTNMLLAMNCSRFKITPGEYDASHNRRKNEDILRRSAICVEVDIPADMNCTVVELRDLTILRRRLSQGQDSAEHKECCISISNTAVEFNDVVFRQWRLPPTEVLAEGMKEKYIAPRTDYVSAEQNNLTFRQPKPSRRVVSTEQDMNCSGIKGNYTASEPYNHSCRRRSLPPNTAVMKVGGLVCKHRTFFLRTNFPPNESTSGRNDDYIGLTSESNQSVCARPVTGSLYSGQVYRLHSLNCLGSETLLPDCNYQLTVVYIALDSFCSDHYWHIACCTVGSSITVILIVWYCIGVFSLRAMVSDDWAYEEESGPSYAPSGPLPGTFLGPALDIRSDSLRDLPPELQDVMGLRAVRPGAVVRSQQSVH